MLGKIWFKSLFDQFIGENDFHSYTTRLSVVYNTTFCRIRHYVFSCFFRFSACYQSDKYFLMINLFFPHKWSTNEGNVVV